jgi:hypothetical protein
MISGISMCRMSHMSHDRKLELKNHICRKARKITLKGWWARCWGILGSSSTQPNQVNWVSHVSFPPGKRTSERTIRCSLQKQTIARTS